MRLDKVLTTGAIAIALALAGCGSQSTSSVKNDLRGLLDDNAISYTSIDYVVHQNANEYIATVTMQDGSKVNVNVTDDGKTIYEQGISAP